MSAPPTLEESIATHERCRRVPAGLFTRLQYGEGDGEEVWMGFCCFTVPSSELLDAFNRRDIAALAALARAVDDEGQPAPSAVRLDLAYTASGRFVGLQPVRYDNWVPIPDAPAWFMEGDEALAVADTVRSMNGFAPT